jgi:general secretion pathway protein K
MTNSKIIQRGVALLAVLWLVAAMSLIITGIVQAVRSEARITGLQRQAVVANAMADAAILLALQSMHAKKVELPKNILVVPVQFEGQTNEVSVRSLNGLIDINNASVALLSDLFRYGGAVTPQAAQSLGQGTVDFRQTKSAKGRLQGFDAIEDLLSVPGLTYDLYVKIKNLVTADLKNGSGRVNPLAAPLGVLQVLTGGDVSRAAILAATRDADPSLMDTSFLKPDQIEMTASSNLQFQVRVALPDGGVLQKMWLIYWGSDPRSGLPWRVLGSPQTMQHAARPEQ